MSFRRKLLVGLSLIVFLTVGTVSWIVSIRTRRVFERADEERTAAIVNQFRHEFDRRGEEVVRKIEGIASSEAASRMALELNRTTDYAPYVTEAKPSAEAHQLDFLEFVASDGAIISSAQWAARFGYIESINPQMATAGPFLKREELPDGMAFGLFAVRAVRFGEKPLYVIGGERLDQDFLATLALPAGMRAILYRNVEGAFSPQLLVGPSGPVQDGEKLAPIIQNVKQQGRELTEVVNWSPRPADSERFHAIPLQGAQNELLGVLLVGSPRRGLVELQHHIRAVAFIVGGIGILCAILLSSWVAARVTHPIEQLAEAAREVAAGNWNAQVDVNSGDEIGELALAFNRMTRELIDQREHLVQAERVAAWRELARRLAHELKNPLFPLQITVENLLRSRELSPDQFDEVFRESTSTLLAELANLKAIIGRFSDFSKMPQPQLQPVQLNDIAHQVVALHGAHFQVQGRPQINAKLELDARLPKIDADPDLLHRVISNLVLNAMDAMADGGTIRIRTQLEDESVVLEVGDTGTGLTREECERLFTPYYTTKQHGTGLGLAIVQSVVSDHGGSISVDSMPGKGTTFRIELPLHHRDAAVAEKLVINAARIS